MCFPSAPALLLGSAYDENGEYYGDGENCEDCSDGENGEDDDNCNNVSMTPAYNACTSVWYDRRGERIMNDRGTGGAVF